MNMSSKPVWAIQQKALPQTNKTKVGKVVSEYRYLEPCLMTSIQSSGHTW